MTLTNAVRTLFIDPTFDRADYTSILFSCFAKKRKKAFKRAGPMRASERSKGSMYAKHALAATKRYHVIFIYENRAFDVRNGQKEPGDIVRAFFKP